MPICSSSPSFTSRRFALLAATALLLAACGNKGQLTLPPKDLAQQKAAAPAPAPVNPAPDNNSTTSPPAAAK